MSSNSKNSELTRTFKSHTVDVATFGHREHLQVAYELLCDMDFVSASTVYANGIRIIATNAGAADKFNATITYAFLSLIAERLVSTKSADFDAFLFENPDLMSKDLLLKSYSSERLNSEQARAVFLLPDLA